MQTVKELPKYPRVKYRHRILYKLGPMHPQVKALVHNAVIQVALRNIKELNFKTFSSAN